MRIAVIGEAEVQELLSQVDCIELMAAALTDVARGRAVQPLRGVMPLFAEESGERKGVLGLMPAQIFGEIDAHGVKAVNIFPGNHGTAFDAHQGVVVLFEPVRGCPVAVLEGSSVTAIRTGSVSALATRWLAREDATTLGLLGAGVQARTHLEAIRCVRRIDRVKVWSRGNVRAREFAAEQSARYGIEVEAVATPREAVEGSAIVCALTASGEPVLEGPWLEPGTHVNAVGACQPANRELDSEAVRRASLFTDRIESLVNEAGDYLIPLHEGVIDADHIVGELGQVLLGEIPGRSSAEEITLFKSLGIGVEDLAAGWHVFRLAVARGMGTWIEFGSAPEITPENTPPGGPEDAPHARD